MRVWHHSLQMIKPVAKNRSYRWWFGFNFLHKRYEILTPENQNSAPVNIKTKLLFGFVGFFPQEYTKVNVNIWRMWWSNTTYTVRLKIILFELLLFSPTTYCRKPCWLTHIQLMFHLRGTKVKHWLKMG